MSRKRDGSRFDGRGLLIAGWSLFAAWVLVHYGIRLGLLFYAELGLGMDTNIVDRDFANYWVGGQLVLDGTYATLFDQRAYNAYLKFLFGAGYQIHAWSYPPHFLAVVAPLGLLEYRPALIVFLAVTFALFVWASREFVRRFAPETSPRWLALAMTGFVFLQIEATQNGFLLGALLLATFATMRERPVLAGFFLAVLTMKPQLGFLIPLLALIDRNWKLLGSAVAFTVVLIAGSVLCFGVDVWDAYFAQVIPYQNLVMNRWEGVFLRMMPSIFGGARTLGFAPSTGFALQAVVSLVSFGVLVRLLFRLTDPLERAFAILAGTFLISPYAFNYDMGAMSLAAACLALRARAEQRIPAMLVYGALAVLPAAMKHLANLGAPLSPLLLAAAFYVLWTGARPASPAATPLSVPS
ncbi:MAG TPA: glycosyltransferase family 87 protein [Steroidobacteraceae bacterium]|nr:glycosyltransferase family 87 protein [Steroidobacteraceae bacterium]